MENDEKELNNDEIAELLQDVIDIKDDINSLKKDIADIKNGNKGDE